MRQKYENFRMTEIKASVIYSLTFAMPQVYMGGTFLAALKVPRVTVAHQ